FTFSTKSVWWLDAGNGRDSGQVLIGNAPPDKLAGTFLNGPEVVLNLPFPTVQQPALLVPTVDARPAVDCAQAVVAGDQSPTINQAMATVVLEYTRRLLQGTLPWMATYLDLHAGTMTSVAATPEQVARLTGVPVKTLVHQWPGPKPCHWCGGIHEQQAPHEW
ncbi:MAG: hypothetical protein Q8P59_10025, partial [Dehalococcoidia bacterium]|nr:hypothetical protein [Dehalococcoidia bacterium]